MNQPASLAVLVAHSPGSAPSRLENAYFGPAVRTLSPVAAPDVLRHAIRHALEELCGPHRNQVPAFVAAASYSAYTATYFAERHEDPTRRLRPSHSIQMESSRLIQGLDDELEVFFLCTPGRDLQQSMRAAQGAVAAGAPAALVCDIAVAPGEADGKPALSAAALLLSAVQPDIILEGAPA
ncbi:hypothetical protein [Actinoplanes sp. TFC3]|uniref:hypothetical protein n=1 Tax=Actinoplanes sp. TFC3 TaxID=1710355 RepID=UPI00082F8450|nr:hypothetical protein [Actinoplanes sp. TFC3]